MADLVDILYVAWNRLEFTRASFEALLDNTDWSLVRTLMVHDDGSEDGTLEYLQEAVKRVPGNRGVLHRGQLGGATPVMNQFLREECRSPIFAKIDNDCVVGRDWLPKSVRVLEEHPELMVLGLVPPTDYPGTEMGYQPVRFVGGIILARTVTFERAGLPLDGIGSQRRYGFFTAWQVEHPEIVKGQITAPILFLLDYLPIDPWASYSVRYKQVGWQRHTGKYALLESWRWEWWA